MITITGSIGNLYLNITGNTNLITDAWNYASGCIMSREEMIDYLELELDAKIIPDMTYQYWNIYFNDPRKETLFILKYPTDKHNLNQ